MNHGSPVRFAASREMNLQSQILNQLDSSPILLLGSFCRELFAYQVRTSYLYIAIPVSGETRRKKKKGFILGGLVAKGSRQQKVDLLLASASTQPGIKKKGQEHKLVSSRLAN